MGGLDSRFRAMQDAGHHTRGGNAYLIGRQHYRRICGDGVCLPRPESNEEPKVGEEEHPSVFVDRVKDGNRFRLLIIRIDFWSTPELLQLKTHLGKCGVGSGGYLAAGEARVDPGR